LGFVFHRPRRPGGANPRGKLIVDLWEVAYLKGGKAPRHTTVREYERGARTSSSAPTVELHLTVKPSTTPFTCAWTRHRRDAAGKVVGVFTRQYLGKTSSWSAPAR